MSDRSNRSRPPGVKVIMGFQSKRRPRYASEASSRFVPALPQKGPLARALTSLQHRRALARRRAQPRYLWAAVGGWSVTLGLS